MTTHNLTQHTHVIYHMKTIKTNIKYMYGKRANTNTQNLYNTNIKKNISEHWHIQIQQKSKHIFIIN